jgi:hypothetical protein
VVSSTRILAIAPASSPGTINIRVTAVGGISPPNNASRYRYI